MYKNKYVLIFLTLFIVISLLIPTPAINVETLLKQTGPGFGWQVGNARSLTRMSNGSLHVVFYDYGNVTYGISIDNGTGWTLTTLTTDPAEFPYAQTNPVIAVDSNDDLHVAWWAPTSTFNANFQIRYMNYSSSAGTWSPISNLTSGAFDRFAVVIAVNSSDEVYILYVNSSTLDIHYQNKSYSSHGWSGEQAFSTDHVALQRAPALAINATDYIFGCWDDENELFIREMTRFGVLGVETLVDTNVPSNILNPSIAISPNNVIHFAYMHDNPTDDIVMYANSSAGYPVTPIRVSPNGYECRVPAITVCYDNISISIVYTSDGINASYVESSNEGLSWSQPANVTSPAVSQTWLSSMWAFYPFRQVSPVTGWAVTFNNASNATYVAHDLLWYTTWIKPLPWWDISWDYCRRLNIDNNRLGYTVNLTVYFDGNYNNTVNQSISLNGECQADFDDVRFVSSDNRTLLSHWIQNSSNGKWARFWVNNSENDTYIWVYYGNAVAPDISDGNSTFFQFIDTAALYNESADDIGWWNWNGAGWGIPGVAMEDGEVVFADRSILNYYHSWYNITASVQALDDFTVEADIIETFQGDYCFVFSIVEDNFITKEVSRIVHFHKVPNYYYGYDAGGLGFRFVNISTGNFGHRTTWRQDTIQSASIANYYLFNNTGPEHELWNSALNKVQPDAGAFDANYIMLWTPTNAYWADASFVGPIRIRPYSPTVQKFSSYGAECFNDTERTRTNPVTNVEETTATFSGYVEDDEGFTIMVGFLVSRDPNMNDTNWDWNITVGLANESSGDFTYDMTGLTPGQYYYVTTWSYNGTGWDVSSNVTQFLTKPWAISYFRAISSNAGSVHFQWLNPTIGDSNLSISIYYNETNFITSRADGTLAANITCYSGTLQSRDITGLEDSTEYYFSVWTQVNDSGSPTLYQEADEIVWTQATSGRGNFNVTFWNESNTDCPINLSRHGPHRIIVVYNNRTEVNVIRNGVVTNESSGDWSQISKGYIWLNCTFTPLFIDVYWNDTEGGYGSTDATTTLHTINNVATFEYIDIDANYISDISICKLEAYNVTGWWTEQEVGSCNGTFLTNNTYRVTAGTVKAGNTSFRLTYYYRIPATEMYFRCNRKRIFHDNENLSIYLAIANPVYGITTSTLANTTLVPYTFTFVDETGVFQDKSDIDTYIVIYTYDDDYNKVVIHEEFWDVADQVYPWLLYKKNYFMGLNCSTASIGRLGLTPNEGELNPTVFIDSLASLSDDVIVSAVYTFDNAWLANGFYVYFFDSSYTTTGANLSVYWSSNSTLLYTNEIAVYTHNWTVVASTTGTYYYTLNVTNPFIRDGYYTFSVTMLQWGDNITSYDSLNDTLTAIAGDTPFRSTRDSSQFVSWVEIAIVCLALIVVFSFGYLNTSSAMAAFAMGFTMLVPTLLISGFVAVSPYLGVVGFTIMCLSLLYYYIKKGDKN